MLKYLLMLLIKKKKIKTIKKKPNLEFKKKEKGKEIENIISAIKSINLIEELFDNTKKDYEKN